MINFSPILKRFVDKARLPVMMRVLLQRELDRWFETVAQQQYTRKLLFSTLFELMTQVVLRQSGSIRAAWLHAEGDVGVSVAKILTKKESMRLEISHENLRTQRIYHRLIGKLDFQSAVVSAIVLSVSLFWVCPAAADFSYGAVPSQQDYYVRVPKAATPAQFANSVPTKVDLSPFFPVPGEQGQQGSCTAWAIAHAARTYLEHRSSNRAAPWPLDRNSSLFSPTFLYSQVQMAERGPGRCLNHEGISIPAALQFLTLRGVATRSTFPLVRERCDIHASQEAILEAMNFKIRGFRAIPTVRRNGRREPSVVVADLIPHLANGTPVVVAQSIFEDYELYRGGIYRGPRGPYKGYHAVTVVGYDLSRRILKMMNSWGQERWGDRGYMWIDFDAFEHITEEAYIIDYEVRPPVEDEPKPTPEPAPKPWVMPTTADYVQFFKAAADGRLDLVREGLTRGLRGDVSLKGMTALEIAIGKGHYNITRALLVAGADPNIGSSAYANLLRYAVSTNNTAIVALLIAHGVELNIIDTSGYTTLCSVRPDLRPEELEMYRLLKVNGARCIPPPVIFAGAN